MQKTVYYIRQSLKEYYPITEINAFIKIIFKDIFNINILDIYTGKDINLSDNQLKELEDILRRLKKYEPIQYIIGYSEFYGMQLQVNSNVLIPRPETEEMVELILKDNKETENLNVLDIGTGSGCIALAISNNLKTPKVTGWDISEKALETAKSNAHKLNLNVIFERKDILNIDSTNQQYDIIVSNPPYVTEQEKAYIEHNVLDWEPENALFVPDNNPLLYYDAIARFALKTLSPNGRIYFEINQLFGEEMANKMEMLGYRDVSILKDMAGKDRIIKAKR